MFFSNVQTHLSGDTHTHTQGARTFTHPRPRCLFFAYGAAEVGKQTFMYRSVHTHTDAYQDSDLDSLGRASGPVSMF